MNCAEPMALTTKDELEFVVFCIENLAIKYGKNARDVYRMIGGDSDILHNYIIPGYEFLHTQDKEYILEDIEEAMKRNGVII